MIATLALRSAGLNEDDLKEERAVYRRQMIAEHAMHAASTYMNNSDHDFLAKVAYTLGERIRVATRKSSNPTIRRQNINFLKVVRLGHCERLRHLAEWEQRLTDSDKQFIRSLVDCEGALGTEDAEYARGLLRMQSVSDSQYDACVQRMDALQRELSKNKVPEFGSVDSWGRKKEEGWFPLTADLSKSIQTIQSALVGSLPPSPGSLEIQEAVGLQEAHALVGSLPRLRASLEKAVVRVVRARSPGGDEDRVRDDDDQDASKRAVIIRYQARHPEAMQKALDCSEEPDALQAMFDVCRFVRERCVEGEDPHAPMAVFKNEFSKWGGDSSQLTYAMEDMLYSVGQKRGEPCYIGVALKPAEDDTDVVDDVILEAGIGRACAPAARL
jgi:hypothetical protein